MHAPQISAPSLLHVVYRCLDLVCVSDPDPCRAAFAFEGRDSEGNPKQGNVKKEGSCSATQYCGKEGSDHGTMPPDATFDCDPETSECTRVQGRGGAYTSLTECQQSPTCQPKKPPLVATPPEELPKIYGCDGVQCIEVRLGGGTYTDANCEGKCEPQKAPEKKPSMFYSCDRTQAAAKCVKRTSGEFATKGDCDKACFQHYVCEPTSKEKCVVFDSTIHAGAERFIGPTSKTDCAAKCPDEQCFAYQHSGNCKCEKRACPSVETDPAQTGIHFFADETACISDCEEPRESSKPLTMSSPGTWTVHDFCSALAREARKGSNKHRIASYEDISMGFSTFCLQVAGGVCRGTCVALAGLYDEASRAGVEEMSGNPGNANRWETLDARYAAEFGVIGDTKPVQMGRPLEYTLTTGDCVKCILEGDCVPGCLVDGGCSGEELADPGLAKLFFPEVPGGV